MQHGEQIYRLIFVARVLGVVYVFLAITKFLHRVAKFLIRAE